ncbi:hypothetical protein CGCF415_v015688 [Colletotrichum fructicola]|uniref:Uncharacterized protein n=1 Tax=Colletotrichum fructicola (strain Nara gc5) TaxID=1213859 RepID=L2GI95_COLFN|nr:uncharacterized protein CGMCC3_g10257 [Colletotrichum fructicola]XP_037179935.1 uncharacterized protein CGCA056_v007655 [Colletotrichum aenigma]KAF4483966.1 hypothetical protein CGGC5_v006753 [Colletotrichum fructicola Nara gc5]KAE9573596.1 hypothetical protein CGMCC3_g10257 [Colletotrichum fructicola]KAF4417752.1 hypothetical protein CFRS1_v015937 [Colletotrichum fructicola]KAF4881307.1 hypothetical protein CGCFRS4_v015687 [Colletotrichum fructicola]KAF4884016.1 hypothetical protein CGCF4
MEVYRNPEGSGLRVSLRSSRDWNHEIKNEFADPTETCFVRLATQYAAKYLSLSDYLDGVLSHLRKGATKHKWDVPPEDISDFLELDLFAGAVKSRYLDPAFVPLGEHDYSRMKSLASRLWITNDPDEFDQLGREDQTDLSALLPEIADLLLVICYVRRHTLLFRYLIGVLPGPPDRSTFDLLNEMLLQPRTAYWTAIYQHSPKQQSNSADEISMWTDILNFGWVHDPVNSETERFLQHGIRSQDPGVARDDSVEFGSQKLRNLHLALASRGLYCSVSSLGDYLASCKSLDQALDFLTIFPGDKVRPPGRDLYEWESGGLVGSIASSSNLDGKLRTDIMRLALSRVEGVDVNAPFNSNPWEDDMPGRKPTPRMTGLQVAASKGDQELAEVLVQYGARADAVEYITGLDAAGFARKSGHVGLAEWLDGLSRE